jgi:hypothetical protein
MQENQPHDIIPNEIIQETMKLVNEMLKDPEITGKAIHDRNIIIKALKADIEHRKVAFKEIATRYEEVAIKNEALQLVQEENKKLKAELEKEKSYTQGSFSVRMEKVIEKIPGFYGVILRFFFTGPMSRVTVLAFFCLMFIASITGWGFIAEVFKPFAYLYKIMMGN